MAPTVVLGVVALVWGYEKIDLETRFTALRAVPFIGLVPKSQQAPQLMDKVKAILSLTLLGLFCSPFFWFCEGLGSCTASIPWSKLARLGMQPTAAETVCLNHTIQLSDGRAVSAQYTAMAHY